MHASFFGANGSRGAWEALTSASKGNQNIGFYRAVAVTYVLSALSFAVGMLLSVAHSATAVYLLLTKERTVKTTIAAKITEECGTRLIYGSTKIVVKKANSGERIVIPTKIAAAAANETYRIGQIKPRRANTTPAKTEITMGTLQAVSILLKRFIQKKSKKT